MRSVTQARPRCQCAKPSPHLAGGGKRICLDCRGSLPSKRARLQTAKPPKRADVLPMQLEFTHLELMKWAAMEAPTQTTIQRAILCIIAAHWNHKRRYAFPGVQLIANQAHCSRRHVHRTLNELEKVCPALKRIARQGRGGRKTSNRYEFQIPLRLVRQARTAAVAV